MPGETSRTGLGGGAERGDSNVSVKQKSGKSKQQDVDRVQSQPDNSANDGAIDANELKISSDFEFDFLRDGGGVPMVHRIGN